MPYNAFVYVETLTNGHRERSPVPVGSEHVIGDAIDRIATKLRWHKQLGLAANQGIVFTQTERKYLERIDRAIKKAQKNGHDLSFGAAYLQVKKRARKNTIEWERSTQ